MADKPSNNDVTTDACSEVCAGATNRTSSCDHVTKPPYSPEVETKVNKNHTNKKVIKIISICSLND